MLKKPAIIILVLAVLYTVARLWRLSDSCLWFDEIFSVHAAEHEWSSLFWFVAQDLIHPPLFYIVLKFWMILGGDSVFWLRLLPVLFSIFAIFPFVRLGRELKLSTNVILLSLFLLAVNGALIKYTQTLRMYSMLMFLALVSMWLFARYFNRGKSFVPLVIVNILLVYTHYFGWLFVITEIAALLVFQTIKWRRAAVMSFSLAAVFLPWFIAIWQAAQQGSDLAQNIGWQARPGAFQVFTFAIDVIEPFYFQASNIEPSSIFLVSIPLLLISATGLVLYFINWKREEHKQSIYLLILFSGIPIVIAFVASWLLPHSVWGTRHLIIVLPPLITLIAHAILSIPTRPVRIGFVALVLLLSAAGSAVALRREMPRHVWCEWNNVAADIRDRTSADEHEVKIYALENLVAYHLWFALRDSDRHRVRLMKGVDAATDDATYFLPRGFDTVGQVAIANLSDETIWLAFRTSRRGEAAPLLQKVAQTGYTICSSETVVYGETTVYWMKLRRGVLECE